MKRGWLLAGAFAAACAVGVFVWVDPAPQGAPPPVDAVTWPVATPVPAPAAIEMPAPDPGTVESAPVAAAAPVPASRARAFPAVVVDASAETLYHRLARLDVTLDQAGEVAKLHRALERCWMASFHERVAQWASTFASPEEHAMAQATARQERDGARPGCGELPEDAYDRADEWTARLAAQGDPQSMMDYGSAYWTRGLEHARTDPGRLAEYRRTTLAYLNALIDQGYVDALIGMASIRQSPTWGEPQPAEVWAYVYADAKANGNVSSQANLLHSIDQREPPEGRQHAMDLAQELLRRCCGG